MMRDYQEKPRLQMNTFLLAGKKAAAAALPLLLLLGMYAYTEYGEYLNTDFFRRQNDAVQDYYQSQPLLVIVIFTIFCTLYIAAAIPGGQLTPIAAGLFFGFNIGFAASFICYNVGIVIIFLISRYCLGNAIQKRFGGKLASMNRGLEKDGIWYLFIIRYIPIPFFITNLCMGLTAISLKQYIWANVFSLLPNLAVHTYLGVLLAEADSYQDLMSPQLIFICTVILILPAALGQWIISRKRRSEKSAAAAEK